LENDAENYLLFNASSPVNLCGKYDIMQFHAWRNMFNPSKETLQWSLDRLNFVTSNGRSPIHFSPSVGCSSCTCCMWQG